MSSAENSYSDVMNGTQHETNSDKQTLAEQPTNRTWRHIRDHQQLHAHTSVTDRIEDDPITMIEKRLVEIQGMITVKQEYDNIMNRIDQASQQLLREYTLADYQRVRRERRRKWKPIHHFAHAARMVHLIVHAFYMRRKYNISKEMTSSQVSSYSKLAESKTLAIAGLVKEHLKGSIGWEMEIPFSVDPEMRSSRDIRKIRHILNATRDFTNLFPEETHPEVARTVAYEKFDDNRIIAQQDRYPERFYYVLTGRIHILKKYRLSSGDVSKSGGHISKGHTTDPLELEHNWIREATLVSEGQVEVLSMDKSDFLRLQLTTSGPPVDFMRGNQLFKEFPCELFHDHSDAYEVKFYGPDKIILEDSNRTPWLHIVKSGKVKVVRLQPVASGQRLRQYNSQSLEELGTGRSFSHSKLMVGNMFSQRRNKAMKLALPTLAEGCLVSNPFAATVGAAVEQLYDEPDVMSEESATSSGSSGRVRNPRIAHRTHHRPSLLASVCEEASDGNSNRSSAVHSPDRGVKLPTLSSRLSSRRSAASSRSTATCSRDRKRGLTRDTYVQLDTLHSGDVFGIDHLETVALASEPIGNMLISEGAEVVRLNKRFFLQHADNNTMLKIENMVKEYMSEKQASNSLVEQQQWMNYKSNLLQKTSARILRQTV